MIRTIATGLLLAFLFAESAEAKATDGASATPGAAAAVTGLPDLPQWSSSDFDKLRKGELIAGEHFFGAPREGAPKTEIPEDLLPAPPPAVPEAEEYVTEISPLHLKRYFDSLPHDSEGKIMFLIDPQELLAQQEYRDRANFLSYHSAESKIDMFIYLFDALQQLPEKATIASVHEKLYSDYGSAAVVFYHLGSPERSQLVLSKDLRAVVSEDGQKRALRAAVQEAFEKSDPAYQLDNFLVELSIRLYWIEREISGKKRSTARGPQRALAAAVVAGDGPENRLQRMIGRAVLFLAIMGVVGLVGWLGHVLVDRRIKYVFPEVETGPLLGAPHAAGVGAVVSFRSVQIPPSQQRDQVPDYLERR